MRYIWPVFLVSLVLFSVDFATMNSETVVIRYTLDWLNYGVRIERPLFVTLYLTLALGILFSVLYFLLYHMRLHARIRKLISDNRKLQKEFEEEKEKTRKLLEQDSSSQTNTITENPIENSDKLHDA